MAPERFGVLQALLAHLLAACGDGPRATIPASELVERFNIPPDQLDDMLKPFQRLDRARNRDTGGAGLGLAIAEAVAQAHGGRLELENRAEGGLSARIVLPIAKPHQA